MTAHDDGARALDDWAHRVSHALQIVDLKVDPRRVVELAERSNTAAGADAGTISAFLAGYAAGTASASGRKAATEAVDSAFATVDRLCADGLSGPDREGWAGSGQ